MEEALKPSGAIHYNVPVIHSYAHEVPAPPMEMFKASVREDSWKRLNMPFEKVQ